MNRRTFRILLIAIVIGIFAYAIHDINRAPIKEIVLPDIVISQ